MLWNIGLKKNNLSITLYLSFLLQSNNLLGNCILAFIWLSALFLKLRSNHHFLGLISYEIYQTKNALPKGFFIVFVV